MQLHLDGSNKIRADRKIVYRLLTDSAFIASTLPDAEDVKVIDESSLSAKLKVRVSIVSSSTQVKMRIVNKEPDSKAALEVEGSGSGSNMRIKSAFELTGENPTTIGWTADAEISGVMAGLGSTILRGFATKKVAEIFQGITDAIERESTKQTPGT